MLDSQITTKAFSSSFLSRFKKLLVVIKGAGICGLAVSFVFRSRGYNVVILEKRSKFNRFNIINLDVAVQRFLSEYGLLQEFEESVAARIQEHCYVAVGPSKEPRFLAHSDVRELQLDKSTSFALENLHKLFKSDGIYSVSIMDLQNFLAKKALELGVKILGNVTTTLSTTEKGGVSNVKIDHGQTFTPDIFYIAEGKHSETAQELGFKSEEIINECSNEHWIYGNLPYSGEKTYVFAHIDKNITNVIFNDKKGVINIATTCKRNLSKKQIQEQLDMTIETVFAQTVFPVIVEKGRVTQTVNKPVVTTNLITRYPSKENAFMGGDATTSSSPLAGSGGSSALITSVEGAEMIADGVMQNSRDPHSRYHEYMIAAGQLWINKSVAVKQFCINATLVD